LQSPRLNLQLYQILYVFHTFTLMTWHTSGTIQPVQKYLLAVLKIFEVPVATCSDKENSLLKQKFIVQVVLLIIRVIVTP